MGSQRKLPSSYNNHGIDIQTYSKNNSLHMCQDVSRIEKKAIKKLTKTIDD